MRTPFPVQYLISPARRPATVAVALSFALATGLSAQSAASAKSAHAAAPLKWGPAPAVFRKGARMAVLSGNPGTSGDFTVRLSMPANYRIAPHFHPTDEHLHIVSGQFLVGMGDKLDASKTKRLSAGDTITAPATMHHFAITRGRTMVDVSGKGPFQLTYVNPADLPKP